MNPCAATFLVSILAFVSGSVPSAQEIAEQENAEIVSPRFPLTRMAGLVRVSESDSASCKPEDVSCEDDQLSVCGFNQKPVKIPCSSVLGRPGFCDCSGKQCVPNRQICSVSCEAGKKTPDPNDCRQFVYCDDSGMSVTLRCPRGMVYEPGAQKCATNKPCYILRCDRAKVLEYLAYPNAKQYYLFCINGVGEIRSCSQPGYGMENGKCQFQCTKEGLFKDLDPENCKLGMWHACVPSRNVFSRETFQCPVVNSIQQTFDESLGLCVSKNTCGDDGEDVTDSASTSPSSPPSPPVTPTTTSNTP